MIIALLKDKLVSLILFVHFTHYYRFLEDCLSINFPYLFVLALYFECAVSHFLTYISLTATAALSSQFRMLFSVHAAVS